MDGERQLPFDHPILVELNRVHRDANARIVARDIKYQKAIKMLRKYKFKYFGGTVKAPCSEGAGFTAGE